MKPRKNTRYNALNSPLNQEKTILMEITNIESGAFNEMLARMEHAVRIIEDISGRYEYKAMEEWIDNQDACLILGVGPRTLQTFRDNGTLAYSRISHRVYYKPEDVRKLMPLVEAKRLTTNQAQKQNHE